jgi:hypothetical protein
VLAIKEGTLTLYERLQFMFYYVEPNEKNAEEKLVPVTITVKDGGKHHTLDTTIPFSPVGATLLAGMSYPCLIPDTTVKTLATKEVLDVSHNPADMAEAFLNMNYLPTPVFGGQKVEWDDQGEGTGDSKDVEVPADTKVQQIIFDFLDMERKFERDEYRKALLEHVDDKDADVQTIDTEKKEELMDEYTYHELKSWAVSDLGMEESYPDSEQAVEYILENAESLD